MFYIYIIENVLSSTYYIGCTSNISRRLEEHNSNKSKYTRNKGLWVLKYTEEFKSLIEARRREKQIKGWKSRYRIEKLWL